MRKEQALYIYNIHHPTHSTTSQLALSSNEGFFATSKSRTSVHPSTLGFPIRMPNEASYWHGTERRGNEGYYANGAMMKFAVMLGPDSLTA